MNLLQAIPHLFNGNILFVETEETEYAEVMISEIQNGMLVFVEGDHETLFTNQQLDYLDFSDYWIPTYGEGVREETVDYDAYLRNELLNGLRLLFAGKLSRLERKTSRGTLMSVIGVEDINQIKTLYRFHDKDLKQLEPFRITRDDYKASWRYVEESLFKELGEGVGEV